MARGVVPAGRRAVVYIGSHLGYPMDRTPLGGGAMVGLFLARAWAADASLRLAALGSGPVPPFEDGPTARYVRLAPVPEGLVDLSELAYARFCRRFERQTTEWLLSRREDWPPSETVVIVNDISEGPDLARLKAAGYPVVSIWHVDVVDYFNKLYLRSIVHPSKVTKAYEAMRYARLSRVLPDVLRLVFEKQRETVALSDLMVLPSRAMKETISRCYTSWLGPVEDRCLIQPWGALGPWRAADPAQTAALRREYGIEDNADVILTLSRISPEKGVHLLIQALELLEKRPHSTWNVGGSRGPHSAPNALGSRQRVLIVCGEAAFMMGQAYLRKVKKAAARLKATRVIFPGYLSAERKPEHFALADLFVSPSVHESYGLNVVEALRAGLPVLASDHYGVKDILADAYGVRVPYKSLKKAPGQLADAVERLFSDKARLKRMGVSAAEAAETMSFEAAARNILDASFGLLPQASEI